MAAAHARGGRVLAADADPLAPSLYLADAAIRLPPIASEDYEEALFATVEREGVGLLIPTIDTELGPLASWRERFLLLGCQPAISEPELIRVTADKVEAARAFAEAGVKVVPTWELDQLSEVALPEQLVVKPRAGSASQNVRLVGREEVWQAVKSVPSAIVQPQVAAPEVTIDALLSFSGQPLHYVPRKRLRTLAGESIQGVTIADPELEAWIIEVLDLIGQWGGRGPLTLQAFLTEGPSLSEVNARFGGGFPLALAAGGSYPEWLVAMAAGEVIEPRLGQYRKGLYMSRTHRELFFEVPRW